MYVKKNLMLWVAVLALALPLLLAGNANAFYAPDGSKMVPAGGWDITDKGVCVTGVTSAGVLNIGTATSRPDCIATVVNATTSSALCTGLATDGASHYWTSTCVGADGTVISLKDLDRTAPNCNQRSLATGHGAGTMTSKCTGSWTYTGPAGDGAPGFAYTTVRLTAVYPDSASCLANGSTIGYAWTTSGSCTYSYGIKGIANAAIAKKDGSGNYAAAGASVDLSALTLGQAMYNGVSWSTGVAKGGTATLSDGSIIATPLTLGGRAGCLECHNTMSQNNGYAERWKESYLKTGHKNMLRKVTAGTNLIGPDGLVYANDGSNKINFATGTINMGGACSDTHYTTQVSCEAAGDTWTGGTNQQLFYIYGDWMAAAPTTLYNNSLTDALATNGYSCAACHTTGFANSTAGVCTDSSKTTAATCVSPAVWVASVGIEGVNGAEPAATYPGIKGITGTWQKDGITCARCHGTTFPAITSANPSAMMKVQETTGGHNNADIIVGANTTNLCYGCHQSAAKVMPANVAVDMAHPEYVPVKNTGTAFTASNPKGWAPEFNGHILGGMFLNSPHAKFTGAIEPNKLGKYNLTSGTYASTFKGKYCRTSSLLGAGSIMKTKVNATTGAAEIIKNAADCATANGVATAGGYWQDAGNVANGTQGSCTTCHDVHQSIVEAVNAEEPLVRECETCHEDPTNSQGYAAGSVPQVDLAAMNHPKTAGTPFDTNLFKSACEACHMPKATPTGFPAHLWRISTDVNYSTFPSKAAFYGGSCSVSTPAAEVSSAGCTAAGGTWTAVSKNQNLMRAADGTYTEASWIDVDLACGQCHGGSSTTTHNGAMYKSKAQLAAQAQWMHELTTPPDPTQCVEAVNTAPTAAHGTVTVTGNTVSFADASTDAQGIAAGGVTVNWGDGTTSTGDALSTFTHTYSLRAATYSIKHSVTDAGVPSVCRVGTTVGVLSAAEAAFKVAVAPVKYNVTVTVTGGTNVTLGLKVKKASSSRMGTVAVAKGVTGSTVFNVKAGDYRLACAGGSVDFTVSADTAQTIACK